MHSGLFRCIIELICELCVKFSALSELASAGGKEALSLRLTYCVSVLVSSERGFHPTFRKGGELPYCSLWQTGFIPAEDPASWPQHGSPHCQYVVKAVPASSVEEEEWDGSVIPLLYFRVIRVLCVLVDCHQAAHWDCCSSPAPILSVQAEVLFLIFTLFWGDAMFLILSPVYCLSSHQQTSFCWYQQIT